MKPLKTVLLLCTFAFLASCKGEKEPENATPNLSIEAKQADWDRNEIDKLIKNAYRWVEKTDDSKFFRHFTKDSMIVGYDRISHSLYIKQMLESGYFSREFTDILARIFNKQDELLRSGKVEWAVGDLGSFDSGANPWCDCQDTPDDTGFENINVVIDTMTSESAELHWNWKNISKDWENPDYHIKVRKEGGKWKIAWMEGWDYETNVKLDQ